MRSIFVLVLLTLAACRTLAPLPPASWPERRAALQGIDRFAFNGQIAAATATTGFSASLRWQQQDAASDLMLRAPLGVGGAHVDFDGTAMHITSSDGSKLEGNAAQAELVRLLGFEPPLASLRYWLLGAPDPAVAAIETLDSSERLRLLQQNEWLVEYGEYVRAAEQWLPQRMSLRHGPLQLKLHISQWRLP